MKNWKGCQKTKNKSPAFFASVSSPTPAQLRACFHSRMVQYLSWECTHSQWTCLLLFCAWQKNDKGLKRRNEVRHWNFHQFSVDYLVTTWFRGEALLFDVQKRDLLIFLNFFKAQKKAKRPLWQSAEQNSQLKLRVRVHAGLRWGYSTKRYIF